MSNLFFTSSETVSKDDMKKKFVDACRDEKLDYCLIVRQMDNPTISIMHQEDFTDLLASFGGNAATDRLPLVVYRYFPADGHEELVRGARITGFNARSLRNIAAIGNDDFVYNFMENQTAGVAGTALGAFGSAQNGLPASVVAPSSALRRSGIPRRARRTQAPAHSSRTAHVAYARHEVRRQAIRC